MQRLFSASLVATAAALVLTACNDAPKDTHPGQPVTQRKAVFKQIMRTLEPMGMVARERKDYDRQEFLASAQELKHLATQPWAYFPPDSNYPPTRAKIEVWKNPSEFKQAQQNFVTATEKLTLAAQGGNLDLIRPAVKEVEKSCKACHDKFRGAL